jgi:hypothetical protein
MKWSAAVVMLAACAHAPPATGPDDGRFKMLHQVSVTYSGSQYLLQGYVLGKPNGDFRVSAAAMMGPRIFDIAHIGGQWKSKIHFAQLKEKLDPKYLGHAIDRVYFVDCPDKANRCPVTGDEEFDQVEITRDPSGDPTNKKFLLQGKPLLEIKYEDFADVGGKRQATKISVTHAQYTLLIGLDEYDAHPKFGDDLLEP